MDAIFVARDGIVASVTLDRSHTIKALIEPVWPRQGQMTRKLSADDAQRDEAHRCCGSEGFCMSFCMSLCTRLCMALQAFLASTAPVFARR